MTLWHVMGKFVPETSLPIDPNHIARVDGKYYLCGTEIAAAQGAKLLENAIKNFGSYTVFHSIRRN
jgi:hypothetical protein